MKQFFFFLMSAALLVSCGSAKPAYTPAPQIQTVTSLEGQQVNKETRADTGYDEGKGLSADGTKIEMVTYKWWAASADVDNKSAAIALARQRAYNAVADNVNKCVASEVNSDSNIGIAGANGQYLESVTGAWKQFSNAVMKGCEPWGELEIEYNPSTGQYSVWAKVAIRGDRFVKLLNETATAAPANLSGSALDAYMETNKKIADALRGLK